jgi:hypothetical protein
MTQRTDRTGKARTETDAPNDEKASAILLTFALRIGSIRGRQLDKQLSQVDQEAEQ